MAVYDFAAASAKVQKSTYNSRNLIKKYNIDYRNPFDEPPSKPYYALPKPKWNVESKHKTSNGKFFQHMF